MSKIITEGTASLLWSYLSLPLQSEGDRLTVKSSLSQPFKGSHKSELFRNDRDRDLTVTAVDLLPMLCGN